MECVHFQMDYTLGYLEVRKHSGDVEKATVSGTYSAAAAVAARKT